MSSLPLLAGFIAVVILLTLLTLSSPAHFGRFPEVCFVWLLAQVPLITLNLHQCPLPRTVGLPGLSEVFINVKWLLASRGASFPVPLGMREAYRGLVSLLTVPESDPG